VRSFSEENSDLKWGEGEMKELIDQAGCNKSQVRLRVVDMPGVLELNSRIL